MEDRLSLPAGTVLQGDFRITRTIGSGGFGITYEAEDMRLRRAVALKEYYPIEVGERDATMSVRPRTERHRQIFEWGLSRFLDEARTLARFRHPSIVRVVNIFEDNLTAYMVMEFENGQSFETWLQSLGRPPSQDELDRIVPPLLEALEVMHRENFLHRDIAPDNIIVRSDGSPVLLDFGAARHAIADRTHALTRVVKAGYSPQEQYTTDGKLQGPWSDIYAFGATLYRAVVGSRPEEAPIRSVGDSLPRAQHVAAGEYRRQFLLAIDACLRLQPSERPQSVSELRARLLPNEARAAQNRGRAIRIAFTTATAAALVLLAWPLMGRYVRLVAPDTAPSATQKIQPPAQADRPDVTQPRPVGDSAPQARAREKPAPAEPSGPRSMSPEEERALPAKATFKDCSTCPEMVVVPAGEFLMGSPDTEPGRLKFEGPVHKVSFALNFAAARHAVTRDDFKAFVDATGHRAGNSCHAQNEKGWIDRPGSSFLTPPGFEQSGNHPVVCVNWNDAKAYAGWLSQRTRKPYRLLTEAEREYITRAGTATPYWWGGIITSQHANFDTKPRPTTVPTAPADQQAEPGVARGRTLPADSGAANPWGFFHVHGNVAEWVQDCWNPDYASAAADGSSVVTGDCAQRVVRGGAWSSWPQDIRAAYREMAAHSDRYYSVGFRVARDLGRQ